MKSIRELEIEMAQKMDELREAIIKKVLFRTDVEKQENKRRIELLENDVLNLGKRIEFLKQGKYDLRIKEHEACLEMVIPNEMPFTKQVMDMRYFWTLPFVQKPDGSFDLPTTNTSLVAGSAIMGHNIF